MVGQRKKWNVHCKVGVSHVGKRRIHRGKEMVVEVYLGSEGTHKIKKYSLDGNG